MAKYARSDTADIFIPKDKLPENEYFGRITFHRIQSVYEEGYMLKRVWDLDEIAQGKGGTIYFYG